MARSMTGFGKAVRQLDGDAVTVELSAVNHRFLDCATHLPPTWLALEPAIREAVRNHVTRGRLNVWVTRKRCGGAGKPVKFAPDIAEQYVAAAAALGELVGTRETVSLDVLVQLPGVFYLEDAEEDLTQAETVVVDALGEALEGLNAMRATEGRALCDDLKQRIALLRETLAAVEARLPELDVELTARLHARLDELNSDVQVTEDRLAVEVALLAEKSDVTEEVTRFKAHLDHAVQMLEKDEPVGRELNFLTQELQREVNTLGAKVRDGGVAKDVLAMKAELEKFREQTQNIE